jgi:fatty-acyl-CoA synthase
MSSVQNSRIAQAADRLCDVDQGDAEARSAVRAGRDRASASPGLPPLGAASTSVPGPLLEWSAQEECPLRAAPVGEGLLVERGAMEFAGMLGQQARRMSLEARALVALVRAGVFGLESPRRLAAIAAALRNFGPFGGGPRIAALRHGKRPAVIDERGAISFTELDEQVDRLANALRSLGLGTGCNVGILCRNHRYALIAMYAASRAGLNTIPLNTAFSARQATEVSQREGIELLIHDVELAELTEHIAPVHGRVAVAIDDPTGGELERLIATGNPTSPPPPKQAGRLVLLTGGTTGTPRGASRPEPRSLVIPGALLERMPMRARETTVLAPPLFHGTGLLIAALTGLLGSTLVLRRRFDATTMLDDIETHRATAVCVVPVMLQRVLALGEQEIRGRDLSSLRVVFSTGSQLPAEVARQSTHLLGDVIYNLYGTTEASIATLATPADVCAAPASVGKPALGSRVSILDEQGHELPPGATGRIFVGTLSPFEGYTGGGGKETIDGLIATGDVGHCDSAGRLYVDGRDDEMIVSGAENVFPREIEELLMRHPAIADAAAIGVDDDEFGRRLRAFVVLPPGRRITAEQVQAYVKDNLARYKVPREVIFLNELPRTPTGKILKRELAAHTG